MSDAGQPAEAIRWSRFSELPEDWAGATHHLVLWDGECGVCRRWAEWAQGRDGGRTLIFLPYQSVPDPPLREALRADCARAVQMITREGKNLRAGRAVISVLERIGLRALAPLRFPPLVWLTEVGYRLVARNRRLISKLLPKRR
jgi:predicted DCC family thiol-disulfide oxidoreductase YuxK